MPRSKSRRKKPIGTSETGSDKSRGTSGSGKGEDSPLCVEEVSSKEHNVMSCSHQNQVPPIDFEILQGKNDDQRYHDIISEPLAEYVVERYNFKKRRVLSPVHFDLTLKDLIGKIGGNIFVPLFTGLSITRPHQWIMRLIVRMIKVVNDLHAGKSFHLGLQHPENYGLRCVRDFKHDIEVDYEVILLYTNVDRAKHSKHATFEEFIGFDMMGLSHLIFDELLQVNKQFKNFPEDLQDLCKMTQDVSSVVGKRWLLESHPGLWHWKARVDFVERAWYLYENGSQDVQQKIEGALQKLNSTKKWQRKIPKGSPFEKIFRQNWYKETGVELLRYIAITYRHLDEVDKGTRKNLYYNSGDLYENMVFVEMMMTSVFPSFLREMYVALRNLEISV